MVAIESDAELLSFYDWLIVGTDQQWGALWWFLLIFVVLAFVALGIGYLVAAVRHGPLKGGDITYRVVWTGFRELLRLSPRRVWALGRLAIQESIRRRVLVVLAIYVALLLFAGWFLSGESPDPVKLNVSFVLAATTYLVLLVALFLSVFSLPNDIKDRTIYTVVTKPVRSGEIVLGRILGFTAVGTILLVLMGVCSYLFVVRAVRHTHTISPFDLTHIETVSGEPSQAQKGRTSLNLYHRHDLTIDEEGAVILDQAVGHTHDVTVRKDGDQTEYEVGPPRGLFKARIPIFGDLRFKDRSGQDAAHGISVGNEWGYRSFIEGGTRAAAIWTFSNLNADQYPDGLPLELYVRVFRSYKGDIDRGIMGSIAVRNPDQPESSKVIVRYFRAKDTYIDSQLIPRELVDADDKPLDLFDDLVSRDGSLEVWIACEDRAQYFGMAKADCYLRAKGGRFDVNFAKGFVGIWVQMVMVICLGVVFSTFLSGPIAMMATLGSIVLGFFSEFITNVAAGEIEGGGPIESLIRVVTHMNMTREMEPTLGVQITQMIDKVIMFFVTAWVHVLPDFSQYDKGDRVARGFDIPLGLMSQGLMSSLAYVLGALVAGYFFLRIREVAK